MECQIVLFMAVMLFVSSILTIPSKGYPPSSRVCPLSPTVSVRTGKTTGTTDPTEQQLHPCRLWLLINERWSVIHRTLNPWSV
jgi:hypothetical protein